MGGVEKGERKRKEEETEWKGGRGRIGVGGLYFSPLQKFLQASVAEQLH